MNNAYVRLISRKSTTNATQNALPDGRPQGRATARTAWPLERQATGEGARHGRTGAVPAAPRTHKPTPRGAPGKGGGPRARLRDAGASWSPHEMGTPCMGGTTYPPTDCTAVLSAMGGLTAEFGMGSGDPPLHGPAHAGRWPVHAHFLLGCQVRAAHPQGRMA